MLSNHNINQNKPLQWINIVLMATVFVILTGFFPKTTLQAQHVPSDERVDQFERRSDQIDGNNIRATITNWGQSAQSGSPSDIFFEWPINTRRIYIALIQLWMGAEVKNEDGETMWVVDVADFRNSQYDDSESWSLQPIKGYVNPAGSKLGIAQSDELDSWPSSWPDKASDENDPGWAGSWNGFFGKDVFNADQEFFYKAGDDKYDRYNETNTINGTYYPDTTDLSRFGLGLVIDTRIMAWSQILIDDVIFFVHGVKNDGTKDLDKVGVTLWLADLVGGDAQDDKPFYDLLEDVAWMTDKDGVGDANFGTDPVGVAAISFLETPGNATDRIDNDGDGSTSIPDNSEGEFGSPAVTEAFLVGEDPANGIDDNGNGLIDEATTHISQGTFGEIDYQAGVGYADYIDNDGDGEANSPVVTAEMVADAAGDAWLRWPANPDLNAGEKVHLIGLDNTDIGFGFKDGIDNDDTADMDNPSSRGLSDEGSPRVTQAMIDEAAGDTYGRYNVPGTDIVLYQLGAEDLGKAYADGIDNDGDGATDEGIDELIDEMIDESRDDGLDNDYDWRPLLDDNGLDGAAFSGDAGEGDGAPTSGAGTDLPGEKNIDKTDVSESDQIGITNVQYKPAFSVDVNRQSDREFWFNYMIPGEFYDPTTELDGDFDLLVSSGVFPLKAGQTERISLAVQIGQDQEAALRSRDNAIDTYVADYQFAQAPVTPTLRAVAGDGQVTLYWDSDAENSFDSFLADLGLPAYDFEGYRIYRSTDASFLDPKIITDGFGNPLIRKPIAQFDLIDGFEGFHPVAIDGVQFYLGDNLQDPGEGSNGLAHSFIDTDVDNGVTYYYAVTAYDFGAVDANIPPSETPIRIRRLPDGSVETGPNVLEIIPAAPAAGYTAATLDNTDGFLNRTAGYTSSRIGFKVVDPTVFEEGEQFRVIFGDTLIEGDRNTPDKVLTSDYSLISVTSGDTLISHSTTYEDGKEAEVLDDFGDPLGFQLQFFPDPQVILDKVNSNWAGQDSIFPVAMEPYLAAGYLKGVRNPADYRIEIVGEGEGQSVEYQVRRRTTLPARPTNVKVYNTSTGQEVQYAFWDITGDGADAGATTPATFSCDPAFGESDHIVILEPRIGDEDGESIITWDLTLNFTFSQYKNPIQGDIGTILIRKPFLATDEFEFTTVLASINDSLASAELENIKVVPNPYVATNTMEPLNPYTNGRGPRLIRFIHLPPQCTIRIFTISGRLVQTLEHNTGDNGNLSAGQILDGSEGWNLQTKDNLSIAYGVYLYHIDAPGIGEHTGTFSIIK